MTRKLCKKVLEEYFKVPFKRTTINGFIIDFYNKDLKIGLVYNSVHHYLYSLKVHKTYCKFISDRGRAEVRWGTCCEAGIKLITIPHYVECIAGEMMKELEIVNECECSSCFSYK